MILCILICAGEIIGKRMNHRKTIIAKQAERLKSEKRPNVVLIVADDYGHRFFYFPGQHFIFFNISVLSKTGYRYNDIGYHQDVIKTPNLDDISAKGVRLENYYVQPLCWGML